jgi:hypothetical protein
MRWEAVLGIITVVGVALTAVQVWQGRRSGRAGTDSATVPSGAGTESLLQDAAVALTAMTAVLDSIRLGLNAIRLRLFRERPSDPHMARTWDRGVTAIQGYRREREVTDATSALGERPKAGIDRAAQETAQRRVREVQRRLGLQQQLERTQSWRGTRALDCEPPDPLD